MYPDYIFLHPETAAGGVRCFLCNGIPYQAMTFCKQTSTFFVCIHCTYGMQKWVPATSVRAVTSRDLTRCAYRTCLWTGPLMDRDAHLKEHDQVDYEGNCRCVFYGCTDESTKEHYDTCAFRPCTCDVCGCPLRAGLLESHMSVHKEEVVVNTPLKQMTLKQVLAESREMLIGETLTVKDRDGNYIVLRMAREPDTTGATRIAAPESHAQKNICDMWPKYAYVKYKGKCVYIEYVHVGTQKKQPIENKRRGFIGETKTYKLCETDKTSQNIVRISSEAEELQNGVLYKVRVVRPEHRNHPLFTLGVRLTGGSVINLGQSCDSNLTIGSHLLESAAGNVQERIKEICGAFQEGIEISRVCGDLVVTFACPVKEKVLLEFSQWVAYDITDSDRLVRVQDGCSIRNLAVKDTRDTDDAVNDDSDEWQYLQKLARRARSGEEPIPLDTKEYVTHCLPRVMLGTKTFNDIAEIYSPHLYTGLFLKGRDTNVYMAPMSNVRSAYNGNKIVFYNVDRHRMTVNDLETASGVCNYKKKAAFVDPHDDGDAGLVMLLSEEPHNLGWPGSSEYTSYRVASRDYPHVRTFTTEYTRRG